MSTAEHIADPLLDPTSRTLIALRSSTGSASVYALADSGYVVRVEVGPVRLIGPIGTWRQALDTARSSLGWGAVHVAGGDR